MVRVLWLRVVAKEAEVGSAPPAADTVFCCCLLLPVAEAAVAEEPKLVVLELKTEFVLGVVVDLEVKPVNKVLVVCGGLLATTTGEA